MGNSRLDDVPNSFQFSLSGCACKIAAPHHPIKTGRRCHGSFTALVQCVLQPKMLRPTEVRWAESLLARGTRLVICDDNVAKFRWHRAEAEGVPLTPDMWSAMLRVTFECLGFGLLLLRGKDFVCY